ncbi:hypothetical protein CSOJ01_08307 [Colletotrichum sojae]|uniref:Uncharacterized protein n=1 Tax=Colletotrichum sojae TaxID=2175907 RepID=A0A8H6J670_9PEZI|nr:hypothetical protein CSOJ01_08307 [Colletotrichum sojae]
MVPPVEMLITGPEATTAERDWTTDMRTVNQPRYGISAVRPHRCTSCMSIWQAMVALHCGVRNAFKHWCSGSPSSSGVCGARVGQPDSAGIVQSVCRTPAPVRLLGVRSNAIARSTLRNAPRRRCRPSIGANRPEHLDGKLNEAKCRMPYICLSGVSGPDICHHVVVASGTTPPEQQPVCGCPSSVAPRSLSLSRTTQPGQATPERRVEDRLGSPGFLPESTWQRQNPIPRPLRNSGAVAPVSKFAITPGRLPRGRRPHHNRPVASSGGLRKPLLPLSSKTERIRTVSEMWNAVKAASVRTMGGGKRAVNYQTGAALRLELSVPGLVKETTLRLFPSNSRTRAVKEPCFGFPESFNGARTFCPES